MNPLRPLRFGALLLCTLLFASAPCGAVTPNGKLQIIHLDVGQGDGAVLISPLGQVVMIDCGVNTNCTPVANQLAALGVTHVDYHFASHFHADHLGCFATLDGSSHTFFGQAWDHGGTYSSGVFTAYAAAAAVNGRRHTTVKGQVWTLDSLSAHPVTITCVDMHTGASDENVNSTMLRVDYGNFHESFGGDLPATASGGYETAYGTELDTVLVYKTHHHGSATSSSDALLNAIAPKVAVISCGDGNSYGHPTAAAVNRLHNHGVHTYWTERGSASGATPSALWDKVAHGPITINAVWQGGGKDLVTGGSGAEAFSDTLTNPGVLQPVAVDDGVTHMWPLRSLRNPSLRAARFAVGVVGGPMSGLEIYSVTGRRVRTVFRGVLPQGEQTLDWDGRDESGQRVDTGVYFARFTSRDRAETVKFLLIR
jgi:beta-lactamase superfamily II metal-dependent hydrolase